MSDALDPSQGLENGRDHRPVIGLGNTNPIATLGSTFGSSGAPSVVRAERRIPLLPVGEDQREWLLKRGVPDVSHLQVTVTDWSSWVEATFVEQTKPLKPTAPVKLFQQIMRDWDFDEQAAATLLGFETVSDIRQIYLGNKPVGHRDANDRLRSVLRIATDLHDLFRDVSAIRGWLSEAQSDLGEVSPRFLLTEGSMENLLRVKHYVAYLSGR